MFKVRINADVRCPIHPRRRRLRPRDRCEICRRLAEAIEEAQLAEAMLRRAERLGAVIRWRYIRRTKHIDRPQAHPPLVMPPRDDALPA